MQNSSESIFRDVCGIVMPKSELDGCAEQHWLEVRRVLAEAVAISGMHANLVSDASEVGVIQKRIVENLYNYPIVICDVSGKNPNVMLELGLRLAFDKSVIIVKDDKTSYSFDTSPIEHLSYPRDLNYVRTIEFKEKLADKLKATIEKARTDPNYSPFLKSFGDFTLPKVAQKEIPEKEFILQQLSDINSTLTSVISNQEHLSNNLSLEKIKGALYNSEFDARDREFEKVSIKLRSIQTDISRFVDRNFYAATKRHIFYKMKLTAYSLGQAGMPDEILRESLYEIRSPIPPGVMVPSQKADRNLAKIEYTLRLDGENGEVLPFRQIDIEDFQSILLIDKDLAKIKAKRLYFIAREFRHNSMIPLIKEGIDHIRVRTGRGQIDDVHIQFDFPAKFGPINVEWESIGSVQADIQLMTPGPPVAAFKSIAARAGPIGRDGGLQLIIKRAPKTA